MAAPNVTRFSRLHMLCMQRGGIPRAPGGDVLGGWSTRARRRTHTGGRTRLRQGAPSSSQPQSMPGLLCKVTRQVKKTTLKISCYPLITTPSLLVCSAGVLDSGRVSIESVAHWACDAAPQELITGAQVSCSAQRCSKGQPKAEPREQEPGARLCQKGCCLCE